MTTETTTEFESAADLTDGCRQALRELLVGCADTKLLLGYHYGEWTFGTPELEAAVASCSLAQTELGHVRLLHAVLKKQFGDDPDDLIENRPAEAFANIAYLDRPIDAWSGFVAMNFLVDLAVTRLLHGMRGSAFKPLRMSLDKMVDEERYHIHHGRGWFRTLARKSADVRGRLERQVCGALTAVEEWFGPEGDPADRALVAAGVKAAPNREIFGAVRDDVAGLAAECDVDLGGAEAARFEAWDARTRRSRAGGPGDEILFHLRGSKNAIYKSS